MTANEILRAAAAKLAAAGIENPRLEARVMLQHAQTHHIGSLAPAGGRGNEWYSRFQELLARREAREPLAYITGKKEFWSLDFAVGPGALVPRPETETLIEEALKACPDRAAPLRILDLGTGTGCLLVTALTLYPHAIGTGIDISEAALSWARRNAATHGVAGRCELKQGGWTAAAGVAFDLVFCNPPYLATAEMAGLAPELAYEPHMALESGPEGVEAYRALGPAIRAVLVPQGLAFLEIGAGQRALVERALKAAGLEIEAVAPDLSGMDRCVVARSGSSTHRRPQKTVGNCGTSR